MHNKSIYFYRKDKEQEIAAKERQMKEEAKKFHLNVTGGAEGFTFSFTGTSEQLDKVLSNDTVQKQLKGEMQRWESITYK